ncbi:hypothetical protein EPYR_03541 [Erwinia pyrifoliae DSM 12163]|nr:hypothetical protein EPYR_03541 [Erwinia pyrifoliae DSM 12163]
MPFRAGIWATRRKEDNNPAIKLKIRFQNVTQCNFRLSSISLSKSKVTNNYF